MIAVFDGHNDALTSDGAPLLGQGRESGHLDLPRMRAGGMRGGIFAVFSHGPGFSLMDAQVPRADGVIEFEYAPPLGVEVAAAHATQAAGRLLALERDGLVRVARSVTDVDAARLDLEGAPVAVLHLEGAEAIGPELEALELWYAAGLRSLGPVWSRVNAFASGVPFISPSSPDTGPGLTAAGRRLVARCAGLGVMVDLAHMNEAGFWDVARMDVGPLVASHTAAHALAQASRNLTDAQLDAVGSSGGLVGVIFAPNFLRADFAEDPSTPASLIAEHVRYIADRIGVGCVGLGSDFDGATMCAEVGDVTGLPRVLDALDAAGFSGEEVEAIAWGNWRRVLDAWWR